MRRSISGARRGSGLSLRRKLVVIYTLLIAANLLAWAWALVAFQGYPVLLGMALLAYSFGARHAVDADHIAAIDNVTRSLMQQGQRPIAVGLFFSLGHSTVVAMVVGCVEVLGLVAQRLGLDGGFWSAVTALNDHFGSLGFLIIGIFAASWLVSMLVYRLKRYDEIEVTRG
jgi:nickel/cobalt transporter (NiCoT) family protein